MSDDKGKRIIVVSIPGDVPISNFSSDQDSGLSKHKYEVYHMEIRR